MLGPEEEVCIEVTWSSPPCSPLDALCLKCFVAHPRKRYVTDQKTVSVKRKAPKKNGTRNKRSMFITKSHVALTADTTISAELAEKRAAMT
jgi:hypothetical protein